MRTIIGQFSGITAAQEAIRALLERNYDRADISFVANDVASDTAMGEQSGTAVAGGAAVLGMLAGFGTILIPGLGTLLAAGPLAVGISGAAVGAAERDFNWITGSLGEVGVPAGAAQSYGQQIRGGGALVIMGAREEKAENIEAVMRSSGATAVDSHPRDSRLSGA